MLKIFRSVFVILCVFSLLSLYICASTTVAEVEDFSSGEWYTLFSSNDLVRAAITAGIDATYSYYVKASVDDTQSVLLESQTKRLRLSTVAKFPIYEFGSKFDTAITSRSDFRGVDIFIDNPLVLNVANYVRKVAFGFNGYSAYLKEFRLSAFFEGPNDTIIEVFLADFRYIPDSDFTAQTVDGITYYSFHEDKYFSFDISSNMGDCLGLYLRTTSFGSGSSSASGTHSDYISFIDVKYQPTVGYNPNLERVIQSMNDNTDEIVGAIDSGVADIIDMPGVDFVPPEGATEEQEMISNIGNVVKDFGDNVDLTNVLEGSSIRDAIDPLILVYVADFIINPLFEKTPFGTLIKISVPICLLFIILGFAGSVSRSRSDGGDGRIYTTYRDLSYDNDPTRLSSSHHSGYLPGGK